jgi:hypothetical protein
MYQSFGSRPPKDIDGAMSTMETWLMCSYELKAPYRISIKYSEEPFSYVVPPGFPREVTPTGEPPLIVVKDKANWEMTVNAPSLPAWHGLMFAVLGKNSQAPTVQSVTTSSADKNPKPTGGIISARR